VGADSFRDVSTSVFHFKQTPLMDSELVLGFGETPSQDYFDELGHLFASMGQLQIIETPFEDGAHVCTSPSQAVSLIQELKSLHQKGFSHGDIRAYNCVFSDKGSHLIDFDFGGRAGTVTYPEGYQTLLDDGTRIPDFVWAKDRAIQKWHDVYALVNLLLEYHIVSPHCAELLDLMKLNDGLLEHGSTSECEKGAVHLLDRVERFLQGTAIKPREKLKRAVKSTAESPGNKTLGGFGGTPEHRKKK
jgi:serine/threonine protein kinase